MAITDRGKIVKNETQKAANTASRIGGILEDVGKGLYPDGNYVSGTKGQLPSSTNADTDTVGGYVTNDGIFQLVKWDGSAWQNIDNPTSTKTYVDDKASLLSDRIETVEDAQGAGVIGYADKATMDADTTQDTGALALVTNDATTANNGWYRWSGSAWAKRADFYSNELDPNDTSEAVTGNAVAGFEAMKTGYIYRSTGDGFFVFDPDAKTFTVYPYSFVVSAGKRYNLGSATVVVDLSVNPAGVISYKPSDNTWVARAHTTTEFPADEIIIAVYNNHGKYYTIPGGASNIGPNSLQDNAITPVKAVDSLKWGLLYNATKKPHFDTAAKTFTIPAFSRFMYAGDIKLVRGDGGTGATAKTIDISAQETGYITYNINTDTWTVRSHSDSSWENDEVLLATYGGFGANYFMAGLYKIFEKEITHKEITNNNHLGIIYNTYGYLPYFRVQDKEFVVPAYSRLFAGGKYILIKGNDNSATTDRVIDVSSRENGLITYDPNNETWHVESNGQDWNKDKILFATYAQYGKSFYMVGHVSPETTAQDNKKETNVLSPQYAMNDLPDITGLFWQDFIIHNDELIAFKHSSDEDHANMDGVIYRFDINTWEQVGTTINHNFGHCNNVHYDADSDVLMIGNLPGNTSYPAAAYIIYDAIALLTGTTNLDFTALEKTIVDFSGAPLAMTNTAACFGENNAGKRDIAYVSGTYSGTWMKVLFGMGTNQLDLGTYSAADPGKYNGTYKVLVSSEYVKIDTNNEEVIQGMDYYKGRIYTANGHTGLKGSIWNFRGDNSISRDLIFSRILTELGADTDTFTEGLKIYNGKVYHGLVGGGFTKIAVYDPLS